MSGGWSSALKRWLEAGVVDAATAGRIRAYEASQGGVQRQGRLTLVAFSLGALLLGAGILLFVAAHWDRMSPGRRFPSPASTSVPTIERTICQQNALPVIS